MSTSCPPPQTFLPWPTHHHSSETQFSTFRWRFLHFTFLLHVAISPHEFSTCAEILAPVSTGKLFYFSSRLSRAERAGMKLRGPEMLIHRWRALEGGRVDTKGRDVVVPHLWTLKSVFEDPAVYFYFVDQEIKEYTEILYHSQRCNHGRDPENREQLVHSWTSCV